MRCKCTWCGADFSEFDAKFDWNRKSCDRCLRHIREHCRRRSDARRCDDFWPMHECPECGKVGTLKVIGEYGLRIYDGRKQRTVWYMNPQEALEAGITTWSQLTPEEQEAFAISPMEFQVIDSLDTVLHDWGANLRTAIERNRGRF